MVLLAVLHAQAHAIEESPLKLDYGHVAEPEPITPQPMLLALNTELPQPEAPLRLEIQILTRIDHLAETVRQIHEIVMTLPGPGWAGPNPTHGSLPPPAHYRSTVEETLARIDRLESLIADISRILSTLPSVAIHSAVIQPTPKASTNVGEPLYRRSPSGKTVSTTLWTILAAAILVLATLAWRFSQHRQTRAVHDPKPLPETGNPPSSGPTAKIATNAGLAVPAIKAQSEMPASTDSTSSHLEEHGLAGQGTGDATEAIELAEIMVSMGLTEGAANTLVEQISLDPKRALPHWLKLLDIYRRSGMREKFDRSARELNTHFNVQAGEWKTAGKPVSQSSLEDYPRLMSQIIASWRKPECIEYLAGLLEDNRGGTRAGFPAPVAEEILLLIALQQS